MESSSAKVLYTEILHYIILSAVEILYPETGDVCSLTIMV